MFHARGFLFSLLFLGFDLKTGLDLSLAFAAQLSCPIEMFWVGWWCSMRRPDLAVATGGHSPALGTVTVCIIGSSYGLASQNSSPLVMSLLHCLNGCHCSQKRLHKPIVLLFPVSLPWYPLPP